MEVIYTGTKLESQLSFKDPIPKKHNHNIITPFSQRTIARKITMNVQENSKKEFKIIMVEIKTHICYVTWYKLDIMKFQNQTYPNNWRKLSSPNPKKENLWNLIYQEEQKTFINMEFDCRIFSKYLVFQMKNLVFQSKYLVFRSKTLDFDRNTRYFESEISKY